MKAFLALLLVPFLALAQPTIIPGLSPTPLGSVSIELDASQLSVDAGADLVVTGMSATNVLTVGGLANYRVAWSRLAGPGNLTFTASNAASNVVTASVDGTYDLQAMVKIGPYYRADFRTITFGSPPPPVNTPPTITSIANQTASEGASILSIPFTVGDDVTAPGSLTVLATSSNTDLLPNINVTLGGSGASRTVSLAPVAHSNGVSTVTISVTDGGSLSTQTSFTATWNAVNDAPTSSQIANQTFSEDGSAAPTVTISDVETSATALTITATSSNQALLTDASVVPTGTGATRTIPLNPIANANGTSTITYTVSDGTASAVKTFLVTVNAVNDTPVVQNLPNQAGSIGQAVVIPWYANDVEDGGNGLTYTRGSSSTATVPLANITFGGSNTNRTVTITGAAAGTSTITVTATDSGVLFASDTFDFVVSAPANTPPTITDIANQTISEDGNTGALAFTIGDAETAAGSLGLSATSSNPALVPTGNVVFGGSGASRTVAVTPVANQFGSSTITITVSDGAATATDAFTVTVSSVNDAPTISNIGNQTTNEDTAITVNPVVGDVETAVSSLTLSGTSSNTTLVPNGNVVASGTGATRTVVITPAANQFGTTTITLTVGDGTTTAQDTFVVTVNAQNDLPTISDITDRTTAYQTSTGAIGFTVGDVETAAGSLTVSGTSNNQTLVPNANITFGGSGASRTVTVVPANGQSGSATITVVVSDGTGSVQDTFVLTVDPDAPVGAGYFVTTTGAFGNHGTNLAAPWNLDRARQRISGIPASGKTVFIRAGRYTGQDWNFSASGVTYSGYADEWPSIGQNDLLAGHITIHPSADDITFRQIWFENLDRQSSAEGIYTSGDARRTKFLHCVILNMPQGLALQDNRSDGGGFEIYGTVLLFNGWNNSATDAGGHNCYFQHANLSDSLQFENNIDAYSFSKLLNCGGSAAAFNRNFLIYQNILLYGGAASQAGADLGRPTENIALVGNTPIEAGIYKDNSGYTGSLLFGYPDPQNVSMTVTGNYEVHPAFPNGTFSGMQFTKFTTLIITNNILDVSFDPTMDLDNTGAVTRTINNNSYYGTLDFTPGGTFAGWQGNGYDAAGSATTSHRSTLYIRYYLNSRYGHRHKSHVFIHNPASSSTVNIDGSAAGLAINDQFVVLNAVHPDLTQTHAFRVVASGTYLGNPIPISMTSLTVAQPAGVSYTIPNASPKVAALIVKKIN